MSKISTYLKRGIKYILKEHKSIIIKAEIIELQSNNLFKNKNIVITGGGSGLGFYMAKKLSKNNANIIITGRNEEKLKNATKEIGKNCEYYVLDMQNTEEFNDFLSKIYSKYKKIDVMICNAGISLHEGNILNVKEDDFDKQINTNLKGVYFLSQKYIEHYKKNNQKKGNIIIISSERGKQCDDIPYGLTKVALNSLIEGLSYRFYKEGIRINGVAPGVTASNMTKIDKTGDLYCEWNVSKRYFVPEEVAEVVSFLASDLSNCISGEIIHCNAGNHLNHWCK